MKDVRLPAFDAEFVRPPRLAAGSRVALVSPAGPLRDGRDMERALANVAAMQWVPVVGTNASARDGYFAGSDSQRLSDINAALRAEDVDAIWFLRGGYGSMRLLDDIDYSALTNRPRVVIGYSDITALHEAFAQRCGIVTYHGPTARALVTPFSLESLREAVSRTGNPCGKAPGARVLVGGSAQGRLAGGNLSLLSALCGTRYARSFAGCILVLEDINEAVYRIDRMLRQLLMSGALDGCAGIMFGDCTGCDEDVGDGIRRLDDVVAEAANIVGVPCVAGVPVGHIDDQWTVPLGAQAQLNAQDGKVVLDVLRNS